MVHADYLGRPIRMTQSNRASNWQAVYTPFGEAYAISGTRKLDLRFPGQFFLIETGLNYNWHRHYDPVTGRYTQPDPLRFVDGPSVYAYAGASPFMRVDRDGLKYIGGSGGMNSPTLHAIGDFTSNFDNMKEANIIGSDKYFHCKANCEAARRGPTGESMACTISDVREWWDKNAHGDDPASSESDQVANRYGRENGKLSHKSCSEVCTPFRPKGLPSNY